MKRLLLIFALVGATGPARAQDLATPDACLIVVGAQGAPSYASTFSAAAARWRRTCSQAGARTTVLDGDSDARAAFQNALSTYARASSQSPLWVVLLGHGTFDGRDAKFNLHGPDVSATEVAAWLSPSTRPLVFINSASSSAPFLKALSGPGRVVVTATKTGFEQNATRFGSAFPEAFSDPRSDLDRDGRVSLLEAFLSASRAVDASYAEQRRLSTEHALIDDNGDGLGTPASFWKGLRAVKRSDLGKASDGARAADVHLDGDGAQPLPPAVRKRRDALEARVRALRDARGPRDYAALEKILLELGRVLSSAHARQ